MTNIQNIYLQLLDGIYLNFIKDDRWKYLTNGLLVTIKIAFFAILLGVLIGIVVAFIRNAHEHTGKFKILNYICSLYITIIRGTPVIVQMLIICYGILGSVRIDKVIVAIISFGINSGAYQAEIFRSGIQSVPKGQMEAGRSLGFGYSQTMWFIILPQAFKNILPTLANEFIVLLKETSVAGYIAIEDLTKGGDIIRSRTFARFMPLIAVALIYLALVVLLSKAVSILERKLKESDR